MNMTLSPFLSRTLALLLLGAALAAGWALIAAPLLDAGRSYVERGERARELITRYNRVAGMREGLEKQLTELRRRGRSTRGYLTGASHSLAAAALQERIKTTVTRHGGTIRSSQALPPRDEQGLKRLPVRVQLTAGLAALQKILHAFETDNTYLFLDNVNIRTGRKRRVRRRAGQPAVVTTAGTALTVSFELYGYFQPGKS